MFQLILNFCFILQLRKAGDELLAEYRAYIQHEKGEPARVQILYERAVAQFALNADLWLEYIKYKHF